MGTDKLSWSKLPNPKASETDSFLSASFNY